MPLSQKNLKLMVRIARKRTIKSEQLKDDGTIRQETYH